MASLLNCFIDIKFQKKSTINAHKPFVQWQLLNNAYQRFLKLFCYISSSNDTAHRISHSKIPVSFSNFKEIVNCYIS